MRAHDAGRRRTDTDGYETQARNGPDLGRRGRNGGDGRRGRADNAARAPHGSATDRLADRLASATVFGRRIADLHSELRTRAVPTHWTNLFGVVAMACLVVIAITGVWLMFFYTPSGDASTYDGAYAPLRGAEVSAAYASTMRITFDVPAGLLMRQAHHWAALLLPAAILMQLVATFFTGGFRRPRRGMWVLLFLILVASLAGGWSGYALPDDLLSGTGLRITEGIALGIPVVGTWVASLLFGGSFPGEILAHLYPLHVAIVPAALIALIATRTYAAWRIGAAQFPGLGRTEQRVVGVPLLPTAAARAGGLCLLVTGVLLVISATVTINPIQLYGPASPGDAGAGSQPDWYTGFLDGALRLVPPGWEVVLFDRTWTLAILAPLAVVTLALLVVGAYPFIEEWITGDARDHHLLDRPRSMPTRTGIGVAGLVFFGTLQLAGSADLVATHFHMSFEGVILALQLALVLGPFVAFSIARRTCLGLQRRDLDLLEHGYETGRLVRLPGGEVIEVHRPIGPDARARIAVADPLRPLGLRPDARGRISLARRAQFGMSRWFVGPPLDVGSAARAIRPGGRGGRADDPGPAAPTEFAGSAAP